MAAFPRTLAGGRTGSGVADSATDTPIWEATTAGSALTHRITTSSSEVSRDLDNTMHISGNMCVVEEDLLIYLFV